MTLNVTVTSVSIFLGFLKILTGENEFTYNLVQLTNWIKEDRYYHTIIYMRHDEKQENNYENVCNTDKILKYLMHETDTNIINLKGNTSYYLWNQYNRRYMAIVNLSGNRKEDEKLLKALWQTLKRNLLSRLILMLRRSISVKYVEYILNFCLKNKAINVLLIREPLQRGSALYGMETFPKFKLKVRQKQEKETTVLFIDQVKNMHGHPIRLIMNKASSKCYVLRVVDGKFILGGFVGHFFTEFARKRNATLTFPNYEKLDDEMFVGTMDALVENGTYDASTEISTNLYSNNLVYTKTYDYMDWCMMVPVEEPVPAYEFYVIVFDTASMFMILVAFVIFSLLIAVTYKVKREPIILRELMFNLYILNGLLGLSFKAERKFSGVRSSLFMIICLAGIVFNTTYVTYLQTFYTSAPKQRAIKSWEDIENSDILIALYREEYDMLKELDVASEFTHRLKIISTYAEYHSLRNSFDSRYIYPVPSAQWSLYEQQQKFFAKPRYHLTDVCIFKMFGMQLPLQPNSPYEEAMNTLIGQVNQAGLVSYWKSLSFLEFVQMKRINLEDKSAESAFEPMKLEDMQLLMFLFVFISIILCICFVIEVFWPHRGKFVKKLVGLIRKF